MKSQMESEDIFSKIENGIVSWISRHQYGILKLGNIIGIWILITFIAMQMCANVGVVTVDKTIRAEYVNGTGMSPQEYSNYNSIVIPALAYMFITMRIIDWVVAGILIIPWIYVIIKMIYRSKSIIH